MGRARWALRGRAAATLVASAALAAFLAAISVEDGDYLSGVFLLALASALWIAAGQRVNLESLWGDLKRDARKGGVAIAVISAAAVIQIVVLAAPAIFANANAGWFDFLVSRAYNIGFAVGVGAILVVVATTLWRNRMNRDEAAWRVILEATGLGIVFTLVPGEFPTIATSSLLVLGIVLFVAGLLFYWLRNDVDRLQRLASVIVIGILVGEGIGYGAGFTKAGDTQLWDAMIVDTATGARSLGFSIHSLFTLPLTPSSGAWIPFVVDGAGHRLGIDYQSFNKDQALLDSHTRDYLSNLSLADLRFVQTESAAGNLSMNSDRFVRWTAGFLGLAAKGLSSEYGATGSALQFIDLFHSYPINNSRGAEILRAALEMQTDTAEANAITTKMGFGDLYSPSDMATVNEYEALGEFANGTAETARLVPAAGGYRVSVTFTVPSGFAITGASGYLLPETKWNLNASSWQVVNGTAGEQTVNAFAKTIPGGFSGGYPGVLVIYIDVYWPQGQGSFVVPYVIPLTA